MPISSQQFFFLRRLLLACRQTVRFALLVPLPQIANEGAHSCHLHHFVGRPPQPPARAPVKDYQTKKSCGDAPSHGQNCGAYGEHGPQAAASVVHAGPHPCTCPGGSVRRKQCEQRMEHCAAPSGKTDRKEEDVECSARRREPLPSLLGSSLCGHVVALRLRIQDIRGNVQRHLTRVVWRSAANGVLASPTGEARHLAPSRLREPEWLHPSRMQECSIS